MFSSWSNDELAVVDPDAWLDSKEWKMGKKIKYFGTIDRHLKGKGNMVSNFEVMVKSGEVFESSTLSKDNAGFVQGVDERPR